MAKTPVLVHLTDSFLPRFFSPAFLPVAFIESEWSIPSTSGPNGSFEPWIGWDMIGDSVDSCKSRL